MVDFRFFALLAALFIYALWGTPTPDNPGMTEFFVGLFLVLSVGTNQVVRVVNAFYNSARWEKAGRLLLLYGLIVPSVTGVLYGYGLTEIFRDVVPFLFLLLPVFLYSLLVQKKDYAFFFTVAVIALGVLFAGRVIMPLFLLYHGVSWRIEQPADPFYLANSPTVLFAALLLLGLAGRRIYEKVSIKSFLQSSSFMALAFLPMMAMLLVTQRASIGFVGLTVLLLLSMALMYRPYKVLFPLFVLLAMAVLFWPFIHDVMQALAHKTALVGGNMRWREAMAVLQEVDGSFLTILFGKGWGASFVSPAVGGMTVSFTHNLVTSFLLKSGLCGVALVLFYLGFVARALLRLFFKAPVMALALAGPFCIDFFLYASFKSLDFGLVLLLILLWSERAALLNFSSSCSIQTEFPIESIKSGDGGVLKA